jgi:hypothetical protein
MQFLEIQTAVSDQFGDTSAAMVTRIKRYINWCQQDICSKLDTADFMYATTTFNTANATKVYSLASTVGKVIDILNPASRIPLGHVTREELDNLDPARSSSGTAYYWTEAGRDATGYMQVELYPVPTGVVALTYNYRKLSVDLSGDTGLSIIPVQYHRLLYLGAVAQCYDYDQDPSSLTYWTQYDNAIEDMKKDLMSGSEDTRQGFRPFGKVNRTPQARLDPNHFNN